MRNITTKERIGFKFTVTDSTKYIINPAYYILEPHETCKVIV